MIPGLLCSAHCETGAGHINGVCRRLAGVLLTQAAADASSAIESYTGPQAASPASFMPLAPSVMFPYPVRSLLAQSSHKLTPFL